MSELGEQIEGSLKPEGGVRVYPSGAKRSVISERYDLIPPLGVKTVAQVMGAGAERYGENNWQKGMPVSEVLNHALAHVFSHLRGDTTEDHLGHAAANLLIAIDLADRSK